MEDINMENDGVSLEVIHEISTAEARRSADVVLTECNILNELSGHPRDDPSYARALEHSERCYKRRIVENLARFSGVIPQIDSSEYARQLLGSDDELAEKLTADMVVHAAALKRTWAKSLEDRANFESDIDYLMHSKRELAAVLELSQSNGTPLSKVYEDDELYLQLKRRIYTPQEVADLYIHRLKELNIENKAAFTADFYQESNPHLQLDREKMISHLKNDPNLSMNVRVDRDGCRQMFMYEALQTWGPEGLDQLPGDVRERLRPRLKIVSALAKLMESQISNE